MAWFDYFTTPAPTGSIPSWLAAPLGLLPYTPPSTTVPIPPNTMAQPRPNFMGPGRDQFNSVRGVTEAVTGSPFAPTPFDESPNVFRPGAAPGQIDVATKPPLPDAPRNPAPMMARNPAPAATSMMDVDTLPLVNSVPYAQKAATPAAPQTSTRKPFDWGPDATLWPMLMQAGAAMMQPSWYGLGGQFTQGLSAASEAAMKAPLQRAQRRLLEAQAGEAESKGEIRKQAQALAASLPKGHPAIAHLMFGNYAKAAEHLGMDPEKLIWINDKGEFVPNLALAQMKAHIQAAQGAYKWQEVSKDRYGNPVMGYPPIPPPPNLTGPSLFSPQRAETPPAPSATPTQYATPGTPTGPGTAPPLAPGAAGQTPGQKKQDEEFASDVVKWKQEGRTDAVKNLEQLRSVYERLKAGERLTGPEFGALPDSMKKIVFPSRFQAYEQVQEVVQRNLRAVLGGQFAEREGAQLISRAYNPYLPPEQNAERIARLMSSIEQAAKAKEDMAAYFDKYGTLAGYRGPTLEALKESVRASVRDVAAPQGTTGRVLVPGKKLNGRPVYWNPTTRKYETD